MKPARRTLLPGAAVLAALGVAPTASALTPADSSPAPPYPSALISNIGTDRVANLFPRGRTADRLPVVAQQTGGEWSQIWQVGRYEGGTVLEVRTPEGQVRVLEEDSGTLATGAVFHGTSEQIWSLEAVSQGYRIHNTRYGNCLTDLGPARQLAGRPCGTDQAQVWRFDPVTPADSPPATPDSSPPSAPAASPSSGRLGLGAAVAASAAVLMLLGTLLLRHTRRRKAGPRGPGRSRVPARRKRAADALRLAAHLADHRLALLADQVVNAAEAVTDNSGVAPTPWAYAVLCADQHVTVKLAGTDLPEPPGPWRRSSDIRTWSLPRDAIAALPAPSGDTPSCYVVLGSADHASVLVDLFRAPGLIALGGDQARRAAVARSLIRQITAGHRSLPVALHLSGDLAPDGRTLSSLLDELAASPDTGEAAVLFCAEPSPEDTLRLEQFLADRRWLRAVVVGADPPGTRWVLEAAQDGTLTATPLGLTVRTAYGDAAHPDPAPPASAPPPVPVLPAGLRRVSP
ncbi:RICIN domain-containing protein [Kitasatospora sp. NPDC059571]|uniref:RICIN domain-containing protein n=1 Tax=Kitasatospora sp. NPDC059571 TaxID=3346871 RepID=UPI0036BF9F66